MVYKPKFQLNSKIVNSLTQIERNMGYCDAIKLSRELLSVLQEKAIIEEAYYSTSSEFSNMSLKQLKETMQNSNYLDEDLRIIANYIEALKVVRYYLKSNNDITKNKSINKNIIRDIYRQLINKGESCSVHSIKYRESKIENIITTNMALKYQDDKDEVNVMINDLVQYDEQSTEVNSVILAGILQFQIIYIQPFKIYNEILAKIVAQLCLYRDNYQFNNLLILSEYYGKNKKGYYDAIKHSIKNDIDITAWLEYFSKALEVQSDILRKSLSKYQKYEELKLKNRLSERQIRLINNIIKYDSVNIRIFNKLYPYLTKRTLQMEISKLVDMKLLQVIGNSTKREYALNI